MQAMTAALVLVDVVNHFEFPDGEKLLRQARKILPALVDVKTRAKRAGLPTIYVNDNFGQWRSNFTTLLAYCRRSGAPGREFVQGIAPDENDYLVLKPMHSAFYQTPLDVLIRYLDVDSLILAGLTTDSCILCTAHDANMRDLKLFIPADCCASRTRERHLRALHNLRDIKDADTSSFMSIDFARIGTGSPIHNRKGSSRKSRSN
jgi:nicotinamidase-related amidase